MANDPIKLVDVGALDRFKTDIENEIPDSVQYSTMPTASADWVGKIVQYIGTTTASYTNGYFYKCVNNSGTYSWQAIDVQAAGGGDVSSKADKVSNATNGNFAGLDESGNLTDSGKKASDFATSAQGGKADTAVQTIQIGGTAQTKINGVVNLPAYPTTLPASDTTSSYSASGTAPVNGTAVAAALGTLDVSSVGGNGKYIQSISETDGKISATAADMPTSLPASDVHDWAKASSKPSYTASEVGAIATTAKGAANGVAELDSAGKVPSSQLPSFVDDVLEYTAKANFPTTGEAGKIYVDKTTNLTWRWSGSAYVEISPSLALGETSSTAYRGDRGATAYSHATDSNRLTTAKSEGLYKIATTVEGHVKSVTAVQKSDITGLGIPSQDTTYSAATQSAAGLMSAADKTKLDGIATGAQVNAVTSVAGKTGAVTLNSSDVGLGNVGNFKAVSTVASQGLSSTEQANARANIGAGTSSFDGAYSSLSGTPTLGTAAAKNVASSGNASTTQVVMGNDTRLSDARTPTSHSHDAATTSNAGFMSASDKTKLNGLANIKSVGSGLDLNGSTGELTATGGGSSGGVKVYSTNDFDPEEILGTGKTTPCVMFNGHSKGKILRIEGILKDEYLNSSSYWNIVPSPRYIGQNLFKPSHIQASNPASTYVTIEPLGNGKIHISGTVNADRYIMIGNIYKIVTNVSIKCFYLSGNYGTSKISMYSNNTDDHSLTETFTYQITGSGTDAPLYFKAIAGETYDFTMCVQAIGPYGSHDHYEAPFDMGTGYGSYMNYVTSGDEGSAYPQTYIRRNSSYQPQAYMGRNAIEGSYITHTGINLLLFNSSTDAQIFKEIRVYYTDESAESEYMMAKHLIHGLEWVYEGIWYKGSKVVNYYNSSANYPKDSVTGLAKSYAYTTVSAIPTEIYAEVKGQYSSSSSATQYQQLDNTVVIGNPGLSYSYWSNRVIYQSKTTYPTWSSPTFYLAIPIGNSGISQGTSSTTYKYGYKVFYDYSHWTDEITW